MNKKIAPEIAIGILVVITVILGTIFWLQNERVSFVPTVSNQSIQAQLSGDHQKMEQTQQTQSTKSNLCKVEYKVCDDGSSVSREGEDCEFSPCPETSNSDAHGCDSSANQYWCKEMQKCVDASRGKCYTPYSADWKVYRNTEYGFEFQYPKDYQVTEMGIQKFSGKTGEVKMEWFQINSLSENVGVIVRIYVSSDPKLFVGPDDRENRGEKTVNGIKFSGFFDPGMGDRIGYHAKHGNFYYEIDSSFDSGQLDEIISTFKFID